MRGTIGGKSGSNLTPIDIVEMTAAYGQWLLNNGNASKVIIGRDGRISGKMVSELASNTLTALGIDVVDLGLSTTPTVEMAVPHLEAGGGIIFTASHNPKEWNALKLLNQNGEFISAEDGEEILSLAYSREFEFAQVNGIGQYSIDDTMIQYHIDKILALKIVDSELVRSATFKVVVDCINSTGVIAIVPLLEVLGCDYALINDDLNGDFAHDPEPLPKNLSELSETVIAENAHLGIAVDPDVDRLVFVMENGEVFGEEYSLVAIADYILQNKQGDTVSNLSSTRALADITKSNGGNYHAAAVGEVNVVKKMKEVNAVIGGEGNGGIILPELHYGRDALVGIAIMLSYLAKSNKSLSELKKGYPDYSIIKTKLKLDDSLDLNQVFLKIKNTYLDAKFNEIDGLKMDLPEGWVHLRKSNTEPVVRIIAEAKDEETANQLINKIRVLLNGNA